MSETATRPDTPPAGPATPGGRHLPRGFVLGGRFEIDRAIGEGATGFVYAARDRQGDRDVALKVLHPRLLGDRQVHGRFHREANILEQLRGPHIVPMIAFGEDQGLLYMALEHVQGCSIEALAVREGPIGVYRAVHLLLQVCEALEAAHQAGVIHRDLKPSNIMVERAPDGGDHVRVLDFGMAKVVRGDGLGSTALTEQNMVFGTPEYMSPEQARGDDLDGRCDVYAAGVILYELLTGRVPFSASTPVATMTAHLFEAVVPPSGRSPARGITPALEAVVLHALAKKPRDRYPTAAALRDALAQTLRAPRDVVSVRPPPSSDPDDLGRRSTDLPDGAPPGSPPAPRIAVTATGSIVAVGGPPETRRGAVVWTLVAVVSAAVGVAIGIALAGR